MTAARRRGCATKGGAGEWARGRWRRGGLRPVVLCVRRQLHLARSSSTWAFPAGVGAEVVEHSEGGAGDALGGGGALGGAAGVPSHELMLPATGEESSASRSVRSRSTRSSRAAEMRFLERGVGATAAMAKSSSGPGVMPLRARAQLCAASCVSRTFAASLLVGESLGTVGTRRARLPALEAP